MRRVSGAAAALVASLAGAGVVGVAVAEPVTFQHSRSAEARVLGATAERGTDAEPPESVDFLAGDQFSRIDDVEPSTAEAGGNGAAATETPQPTEPSTTQPPETTLPAATVPSIVPSTPPATVPPAAPTTAAPISIDQRVLDAIGYPVLDQLPGWRIEFHGGRQGYRGSTYPGERLIQIYVRDGDTLDELVHVTAHEIGHAIDVTYLSPSQRARFNVARGRSADYQWWVQSGGDDFASGSGDWSECFAAVFAGPIGFQSRLGGLPDDAQAALVRSFARA